MGFLSCPCPPKWRLRGSHAGIYISESPSPWKYACSTKKALCLWESSAGLASHAERPPSVVWHRRKEKRKKKEINMIVPKTVLKSYHASSLNPHIILSTRFPGGRWGSEQQHGPRSCRLVKNGGAGTSLVAQWLRICLPTQGTRVQSLVWEDPMCCGEQQSACATTSKPVLTSPCATTRQATAARSPCTAINSSPRLTATRDRAPTATKARRKQN